MTFLINRILIVGLGSMGLKHLKIARKLFPNAQILVLRHRQTEIIPDYADQCISSIDEAIFFAPQIAIICNPAVYHLSIAQELALIGTHLFIEKPLSYSSEGVDQLIETCKKKKAILMTGYNLRKKPSLIYFRNLLKDKKIGEILSFRSEVGQYLPSWRPESDYRVGVSARKNLGGGVLLELSHELDYLRWIFGDVEWVRATISKQSSLEIDVEDSAHMILGISSKIANHELIGTLNMDFVRHDYTRICTAIGSKGSLKWNGDKGEVSLFDESTKNWSVLFSPDSSEDETYEAEWQELTNCVITGDFSTVSGEDGLRVLEIIEAARASAPTGMQVSVSKTTNSDSMRT